MEERAGPSVWARRWGSHRGDTPRCFSRRGLRAKHGGRSAFASEGTVAPCFLLSCAVTPAGTARDDCLQGQGSDVSHKGFSLLALLLSLFVSSSAKVECKFTSASLILGEDGFYPEARVCFTDFLLAAADQNLSLL